MNRTCRRVALALLALAGAVPAASAQSPAENILGLPDKAMANNGSLVIVGGGPTPDVVYNEFIRLSGGKSARLVLIPSAYAYSGPEHLQRRFSGWRQYDVASFRFLDAESRDKADTQQFVEPLGDATGVWISGGVQSRLASLYAGTKVEAAIRAVLERGGVVGGTSAGAAVMSRTMIRAGSPSSAIVDKGFGLVERAIVDQHFSQRGRHTRLLGALEDNPGMIGLGVDEGTAVVVQGSCLKVIGDSRATVLIPGPKDHPTLLYQVRSGEQADLIPTAAIQGQLATVQLKRRRD